MRTTHNQQPSTSAPCHTSAFITTQAAFHTSNLPVPPKIGGKMHPQCPSLSLRVMIGGVGARFIAPGAGPSPQSPQRMQSPQCPRMDLLASSPKQADGKKNNSGQNVRYLSAISTRSILKCEPVACPPGRTAARSRLVLRTQQARKVVYSDQRRKHATITLVDANLATGSTTNRALKTPIVYGRDIPCGYPAWGCGYPAWGRDASYEYTNFCIQRINLVLV